MKTQKNILIAFFLNLSFSIFEFIGGFISNSVAIISDSIHDMGDALSIAISYFLERKSKKQPDSKYTYGYIRYSVLGALITIVILIIGSIFVIYNSINRLINPVDINYDGMILLALIGVIINFIAARFTHGGESINQKAVNLHMLEDVLGWIIVLIGAVVMKFTDIRMLDSIMSLGVAIFIFINAFKNLLKILDLFLEKVPNNISVEEIKKIVSEINGVNDVHHIHVWSIDGYNNYATMHIVCNSNNKDIKNKIKDRLMEYGIHHTTLELEDKEESCDNKVCSSNDNCEHHHHHHH